MATTKKKAVHIVRLADGLVDDQWTYRVERRDVRVMAVAEGYAMVRRPTAMPYVARLKELEFQK